jgi:3,4-dihydroxy-9,10-secoandrosta-1,3,5(10)-triene-9,17-dione 4,5-dioxygenase
MNVTERKAIDRLDVEVRSGALRQTGKTAWTNQLALRMRSDERPFRVLVATSDSSDGLAFAGWELPDADSLQCAKAELAAAGITTETATADECDRLRVRGLARTMDSDGFALELFYSPIHDHELFVSPTGVSGFVTGTHGMGHFVVGSPNLARSLAFFTEVMGSRIGDYWHPGDGDVAFLCCTPLPRRT